MKPCSILNGRRHKLALSYISLVENANIAPWSAAYLAIGSHWREQARNWQINPSGHVNYGVIHQTAKMDHRCVPDDGDQLCLRKCATSAISR
jgi:hypothetical protein